MRKLILPIIFLALLIFTEYSYAQDSQTSKDCLDAAKAIFDKCLSDEQNAAQKPQSQDSDSYIGKLFDINPFQTWLNLAALSNLPEALSGAIFYEPSLTFDDLEEKDEDYFNNFAKKDAKLDKEKLAQNFKKSVKAWKDSDWWQVYKDNNTQEKIDKRAQFEIKIPTTFQSDAAVIEVRPPQDNSKTGKFEFNYWPFLRGGEAEIFVEPGKREDQFKFSTPNAEVFVIGTHFLVSFDEVGNRTGVLVYEGDVEVKSQDGQTTKISPSGDKPGLIIVSQKLSPVKLALAALVSVVIVGGMIFIIRKKFTSKGFNKKKR